MCNVIQPEMIYALVAEKKGLESAIQTIESSPAGTLIYVGELKLDDPMYRTMLSNALTQRLNDINKTLSEIEIRCKKPE